MRSSDFKKILDIFEKVNKRHDLIRQGDHILIGFSGGPDSTALLHVLHALKRKYRLILGAAHVYHGISKRASEKYLSHCRQTCLTLGIDLFYEKKDVPALARRSKRSIEDAGRIERYRFFTEIAKKKSFDKIATGHTADDQAETVLFRILRGTGLRGLSGIPIKRTQGPVQIIRPLLSCEKNQILAYLKSEHIKFCVDRTNRHTRFTRNKIRENLLPLLENEFNPSIKKALLSLAGIAGQAQAYLRTQTSRILLKKSSLRISKINQMPGALAREIVFQAIQKIQGNLNRITNEHVEAVLEAVRSKEGGLTVVLPGNLRISKQRGVLRFYTDKP